MSQDLEAKQGTRLLALGSIGLAIGVLVHCCSKGTNDILAWEHFARAIRMKGIWALYHDDVLFNHPPLMGWLARAALEFADLTHLPFWLVFKSVPVLANVSIAFALRRIWERSDVAGHGKAAGKAAFAAYGTALAPMLVASYHGNTDGIAVALLVWSLYFAVTRDRLFVAGLVLGAACNVKLIPLLAVLPALAALRRKRDLQSFAGGLAFGVVPYLFVWAMTGADFLRNVFGYASSTELWGVHVLFSTLRALPFVGETVVDGLHPWYFENGKFLLLAGIAILAFVGRWSRIGFAELLAASMALFLVLTPGFGVQYAIYPAPLMFAVSRAWGIAYSLIAGIYVAFVYASWSLPAFPLQASYRGYHPNLGYFGFLTWCVAAAFVVRCVRVPPRGEAFSAHVEGQQEAIRRDDREDVRHVDPPDLQREAHADQ